MQYSNTKLVSVLSFQAFLITNPVFSATHPDGVSEREFCHRSPSLFHPSPPSDDPLVLCPPGFGDSLGSSSLRASFSHPSLPRDFVRHERESDRQRVRYEGRGVPTPQRVEGQIPVPHGSAIQGVVVQGEKDTKKNPSKSIKGSPGEQEEESNPFRDVVLEGEWINIAQMPPSKNGEMPQESPLKEKNGRKLRAPVFVYESILNPLGRGMVTAAHGTWDWALVPGGKVLGSGAWWTTRKAGTVLSYTPAVFSSTLVVPTLRLGSLGVEAIDRGFVPTVDALAWSAGKVGTALSTAWEYSHSAHQYTQEAHLNLKSGRVTPSEVALDVAGRTLWAGASGIAWTLDTLFEGAVKAGPPLARGIQWLVGELREAGKATWKDMRASYIDDGANYVKEVARSVASSIKAAATSVASTVKYAAKSAWNWVSSKLFGKN